MPARATCSALKPAKRCQSVGVGLVIPQVKKISMIECPQIHNRKDEAMQKRMTISIDETVYEGLLRVVGRRKVSRFLEDLARPLVISDDLVAGYQAMATDTEREKEALEWSNAMIGDVTHAAR